MADEQHAGQRFQRGRAGFLTKYCGNFQAEVGAALGSCPCVGLNSFGTGKSTLLLFCSWDEDPGAVNPVPSRAPADKHFSCAVSCGNWPRDSQVPRV